MKGFIFRIHLNLKYISLSVAHDSMDSFDIPNQYMIIYYTESSSGVQTTSFINRVCQKGL